MYKAICAVQLRLAVAICALSFCTGCSGAIAFGGGWRSQDAVDSGHCDGARRLEL